MKPRICRRPPESTTPHASRRPGIHQAAWLATIIGILFATGGVPAGRPLALTAGSRQLPGFSSVADQVGIDFVHENGASREKYLPETMGGGGVIFDYDEDGWQDIFLVNGGSLADTPSGPRTRHRLYQNDGDGTFTDVTRESDIRAAGYGMGACAADYDNDGWTDLYVTGVGATTLYRNSASGRFVDTTHDAGVGYDGWSTSCAFGDVDNDGYVDLYVTRYVDFSVENNPYCGDLDDERLYCPPNAYRPLGDLLFINERNGQFRNATQTSGTAVPPAYGLGVVMGDTDGDGTIDIYVANDTDLNFLFRNLGQGTFEEAGLTSGVAVGGDGRPLAGMGTDMGDSNGDGRPDLFVTNLDRETHSLYENLGDGLFSDITFASGVGRATLPFVGFGASFFDFDNDTDLDLGVANGGLYDNPERFRDTISHAQRNLLLVNDGTGRFDDAGDDGGPGFALEKVSRAFAVGDLDNDGDLDIVVVNNGQAADVLRNDLDNGHHSLLIRTIGTESNRDGIGARLKLWIGDRVLVREVRAGSGYLGQNEMRAHFGMGDATRADRIEVLWPRGTVDVLENVDAGYILTIEEGGVTRRDPFEP